ncbi:uncharacterized protein LOC116113346 [Pistacia vera]|uniref:uncharacterized protein LOC116113346 n=1 Tax=Pistacia vera TaxID=55513 RepID=UPI00126386F9|nr:uncharacterized protein LOC116113346 [Pistacia vera]
MGQIAEKLNERPQGSLSSNTVTNPLEQVNAITLRSGTILEEAEQKGKDENPPSKAKEESNEEIKEEVMVEEKPTSPRESREEEPKKEERPKQKKEKLSFPEIPPELAHHTPLVPFSQRLRKQNQDKQFTKFLNVFKKLHINIPFADALQHMSSYTKFLKDILANKRKLEDEETMMLTEECSAILQKKLLPKLKDPRSFTIPYVIGNIAFDKVLCDLGASINLIPFSVVRKLGIGEVKPTTISLQLADRSIKHPRGIIEDVLVKVDKFIFMADFFVLDMEEDKEIPLILGQPFLSTGRALIDVQEGKLIMRVQEEEVTFNVLETLKVPSKQDSCFKIDLVDQSAIKTSKIDDPKSPIKGCMVKSRQIEDEDHNLEVYTTHLYGPQSSKCLHKGRTSQFKNADGKLKNQKVVDENAQTLKGMTKGWKWMIKFSTKT